jgi:hypothetical protein
MNNGMNNNKKKRELASTKIYGECMDNAKSVALSTGVKKGSVFRIILEKVLSSSTHEELKALIYGEKTIKIE